MTRSAATEIPYRALILEDDAAIRRLMEKVLGRKGFTVDIATDGETAVSMLRNGIEYSVLIVDLMVPGLTGFEVIDHVKELGVRTPVAVVSAVSQAALPRLDLEIVKVLLTKPFDVDEFTTAIIGLCRDFHA